MTKRKSFKLFRQILLWLTIVVMTWLIERVFSGDPSQSVLGHNIPRLHRIVIDGDSSDWGSDAFKVDIMHIVSADGETVIDADNFNPVLRMGWDDRGLLLLAIVADDELIFSDDLDSTDADMIEVNFSIEAKDAAASAVSTGTASVQADLRAIELAKKSYSTVEFELVKLKLYPGPAGDGDLKYSFEKYQKGEYKPLKSKVQSAVSSSGNTYVLEALVPWSDLNSTGPARYNHCSVTIRDFDSDSSLLAGWGMFSCGSKSPDGQSLSMTKKASKPVCVIAQATKDKDLTYKMTVIAPAGLAGETVDVYLMDSHNPYHTRPSAKLESVGGFSRAELNITIPSASMNDFVVTMHGDKVCEVLCP